MNRIALPRPDMGLLHFFCDRDFPPRKGDE